MCLEVKDVRLELYKMGVAEYALDSMPGGKNEECRRYLVVLAIFLEELLAKDVLCGFFTLTKCTKVIWTECGCWFRVCPDALCATHRGGVRVSGCHWK